MKNLRILSMLFIATIAALAAVVFASRWLTQQSSNGITKVAVATADIDLGQRLSPDFVKLVDWPTSSLPPGAISDSHALDGRVVRASLTRGEPVLESKLTPVGTAGGLSAVIGEGKRAITVRVNDVVGVAGFALPGSYVDIIVNTLQDAKDVRPGTDRNDQSISKIVLEKILVLAVAQEVNRDDTKPKVVNAVTLEVTPEQAEKIDLARSVGNLSLVLRNQVDPRPVDTAGATKSTLLKEPVMTAAGGG
ncbi:Flp pilus assembly protein CpaB, partial [Ralstonia sp. NT80]|uniref:Flp pilus assembly protein CpaB n=1 Tax=Ralstonia sp. NT80 TaxID=1218247 RepID=UPI00073F2D6B